VRLACQTAMTSFTTPTSPSTAAPAGSNGAEHSAEPAQKSDPGRHLSPAVAHELNNMLTIIQGYAENLLLLHGKTPALETHLHHIAEAARRATKVVRNALPRRARAPLRSQ